MDPEVDHTERKSLELRPSLTPLIVGLIIALAAVVTRLAPFGDPVAHVDDQFYLLSGHAILQGDWPYVDIWDRKPVGLFLIYAGIAALGGAHSVAATHIIAGLFAAATALTIARIAERFATRWGGMLAGIAYLVCLPFFGGQTGQSPVFYNLLMGLAGLLLFQAAETEDHRAIVRKAMLAMLLCGLSMTIKQVTFIEGAYFGLAFLILGHRARIGSARLVAMALAMLVIALAPTAAALGVYQMTGRGEAFIFANFISIFLKNPVGGSSLSLGIVHLAKFLPPILVIGLWDYLPRAGAPLSLDRRLLLGWIFAASVGYLFVPYFFDHYALPLLVPLSIAGASVYSRRRGYVWLIGLTFLSIAFGHLFSFAKHAKRAATFNQLAEVTSRELHGGCLYVATGHTQLYTATGACRVTPFVFPDHLTTNAEVGATGVDSIAELRRIFAQRPAVVTTTIAKVELRNPAAETLIMNELRAHYRPVPWPKSPTPNKLSQIIIWSRIVRAPVPAN
ncbi:MAG: hypothetical protein LH465_06355 [Sphingomonas bacterium]|nr:hypothetical protein [Sphingomonas bacterium]